MMRDSSETSGWGLLRKTFQEMVDDLNKEEKIPISIQNFISMMQRYIDEHDDEILLNEEVEKEISKIQNKIEIMRTIMQDGELKLKSYSFMENKPTEDYIENLMEKINFIKNNIPRAEEKIEKLRSLLKPKLEH